MCPNCNTELDELGVVVQATMTLSPITGYSSVEDVEDTLAYYCPQCGETLDYDYGQRVADAMVDEYESFEGGDEE